MPRVSYTGDDGNKFDVKDRKKVEKQLKSGVLRIQSGDSKQSDQQLGYADTGTQTFKEQVKARNSNPFANVGKTLLSGLGRLGQANLQGLREFSGTGTGAITHIDDAAKAYARGLTDIQGKNDIDAFEALNKENPGGKAAVVADLATQIVTDPLTFAGGMGVGRAGGRGLEIIGKSVGKDVAEQVRKKGFQSLSKSQQTAVRTALVSSKDAVNAGGDNKLVSAYRGVTGRQGRTGAERFTEKLIGKEGEVASVGKLVDAQGLGLMGKTLAPGVTFSSIGKATGVTRGLNAARDTKFATNIIEAFRPRAKIVASPLGRAGADRLGGAQKAARALEYRLNDADVNAIKKAVGSANFDARTMSIMDNALDTGRVDEAINHFTKNKNVAAVRTIKTLDHIRKRSTERLVASGLAEHSQLRDTNKYLNRTLTPQAERWIEQNKDKAARLLGFEPSPQSADLLRNAGPQFRRLDPEAAASDLNKKLRAETGIDEFFSTNAIERVLTRSTQINHGFAISSLIDDLSRFKDELGNPYAIQGPRNAKQIKALEKETKALVKDLNKEMKTLKRFEQRRAVQAAGLKQSIRGQEAVLTQARMAREALERKIGKLTDEAVTNLDKARSMDAVRSPATSALSRKALDSRIRGLRQSIKKLEAAARKGEKNAGELRKLREAEKRALKQKAEPLIKALRASAPAAGNSARAALRIKDLNEAERKLEVLVRAEERARDRLMKLGEKIPDAPTRTSADVADEIATTNRTMRAQTKQLRDADKLQMAEIKKLGYGKIEAGPLGEFYAPREIVDELAKTSRMLQDDDALKAFGKIVGGATQAWKNLALNTIVLGTGTSARNAVGNLILMWQAGFKDPALFVPAAKATKAMRRANKAGRSLDTAAKDPALSNWEKWALKNAIKYGQVGGGFNRSDLAKTAVAATYKDRAVRAIDIRNPDSLLTRHMSSVNTEIEDTSRIAFYMHALKQTGNPRVAARMTDDAMIDYQDLTNAERKIKLLIPFYTFTSRNLAIQAYTLANAPGRTINSQRLRDAIFQNDDEQGDTGIIPDYVLEAGQQPFMSIGGVPLTGTFQTPFDAAVQVTQPLADLASRTPGTPNQYRTEAGVKGGIAGLAQNIGGAPGSFAKQLGGEMAGVDPFTGAPLKEGETGKRLLGSLVPVISRTESLAKDTTGDSDARRTARLLSTIGVSTTAIDDKREASEMYRRLRELGASAKRQNIPTVTELKKQGKFSKSGTKKGAYGKDTKK